MVPLLAAHTRQDRIARDTGVIDQPVHLAKFLNQPADQLLGGLAIGGITLAALGFIFLLVTLAYVLVAIGLPVWAGFGIVVLLLFIAAVVLFALGRNRAKSIKGPERFKRELQRTKDALSGQTPPESK